MGLFKDLMSYINHMLGLRGKAKDQADAKDKALNFCSVFFSFILLRQAVFQKKDY